MLIAAFFLGVFVLFAALAVVLERLVGPALAGPGPAEKVASARRWIGAATVAATVASLGAAVLIWMQTIPLLQGRMPGRYTAAYLVAAAMFLAAGPLAGLAARRVRPERARWLAFALVVPNAALSLQVPVALGNRELLIGAIGVSATIAAAAGARGTRIGDVDPPGAIGLSEASKARRWLWLATAAALVTSAAAGVLSMTDEGPSYAGLLPAIGAVAGLAATQIRPRLGRWLLGALVAANAAPAMVALAAVPTGSFLMIGLAISACIAVAAGVLAARDLAVPAGPRGLAPKPAP